MTSTPGAAATYETEHVPLVPVEQSRSGLLPGLSMSLGLEGSKKKRTCVDVSGAGVQGAVLVVDAGGQGDRVTGRPIADLW